jgi:hypothetical protein
MASAGSNQCHALDTKPASAEESGSGITSARPPATRTRPVRSASTALIRPSGSTAVISGTRPTSALVRPELGDQVRKRRLSFRPRQVACAGSGQPSERQQYKQRLMRRALPTPAVLPQCRKPSGLT